MNVALASGEAELDTRRDVFVRFGPGQQLVGILSGEGKGPTLLLPSAGLQPRSGPFRLHAMLAQRLAVMGIRSFRYDVPGVGEAPRLAGCDATKASIAAMDQLQSTHRCHTFAVGGICSAADTGWDVALEDPRVSAVLLLDGVCFRGPWYRYAQLLGLLQRLPREWRHFMRRLPARLLPAVDLDSTAFRSWPDRALAREQFARLVDRRVRMLCIFSGGYADRFLHPRQFEWSFGLPARDANVVMQYWPDCDHTYFGRTQRDRLVGAVSEWMSSLPTGEAP